MELHIIFGIWLICFVPVFVVSIGVFIIEWLSSRNNKRTKVFQ